MSKRDGDLRYYYPNKVFLLIDGRCFSATDIFVGAFKGWRNIQLVGQLYDGRGVHPDIHIDATPESFLRDGKDNVLEHVMATISDDGKEGPDE